MQNLYQVIFSNSSISSDNQELIDAMELSLSEQLFDEPSQTDLQFGASLVEVNDEEENG